MRRLTALLFLVLCLLAAGCGRARRVALTLTSPDRDAAVEAILAALSDGRETLEITVTPQAAESLDPDTLSLLFSSAHYNDACDLPVYPSSRTAVLTQREDGGYTAAYALRYDGVSARQYARCKKEYAALLDEYEAALRQLGEEPAKLYRTLYFLVCQHTEYADPLAAKTIAGSSAVKSGAALQTRGAYGALVERSSICTGYAMLYKALCDRVGLPCWVVIDKADGIDHAWNLILVDGAIRYIDTTNGDRGAAPNADFCMMTQVRYQTLGRTVDAVYIPTLYYDAGYRDATKER